MFLAQVMLIMSGFGQVSSHHVQLVPYVSNSELANKHKTIYLASTLEKAHPLVWQQYMEVDVDEGQE